MPLSPGHNRFSPLSSQDGNDKVSTSKKSKANSPVSLYTQSKTYKYSTGKSLPLSHFESTPSTISLKNYTTEGTLETKDSLTNIQLNINIPISDPVSSISGAKQLNAHETFFSDPSHDHFVYRKHKCW
jgi:hypothetical protein